MKKENFANFGLNDVVDHLRLDFEKFRILFDSIYRNYYVLNGR